MTPTFDTGDWVNGLAEWTAGDTAYLSVAFSYRLPKAYTRAAWYRAQGYRVIAGGPGLFPHKLRHYLDDVAEYGAEFPEAVTKHNPMSTFASRGCPVGCSFCIVPFMEGKKFTMFPDFVPRPVLCDNNLSALPIDYQKHIIARYESAGVPLLDANSGFEPATFSDEVYALWRGVNRGPWRYAYDEMRERDAVERVCLMLKDEPSKKKRVYVLIGNEPMEACLDRIYETIAWGAEPHVQPYMKLTTLVKRPHVRFDWSYQSLTDVARWTNGWVYKKVPKFEDYRRSANNARDRDRRDDSAGLFDQA